MLIEDVEQLKIWLAASLSPIAEADPAALAKYVIALVKKDKPAEELKSSCIDQLDIFLQSKTKEFVENLFEVLESKSYIVKQENAKNIPSTVSGNKQKNVKPSPSSKRKKSKHNQAPVADSKPGKGNLRPASASVRVPVASDGNTTSGNRTVAAASNSESKIEMELKNTSHKGKEKPTSKARASSPETKSSNLVEDWLDYIEIKESFEHMPKEDTEELLCFRKRGRGCMEPRRVPRLPLTAAIQRMRMLNESSGSGRQSGGRGRARTLQERARSSRPHGLHKKKMERAVASEKKEVHVMENAPAKATPVDRQEDLYIQRWQQEDFPSLGTVQPATGSPRKGKKEELNGTEQNKKSEPTYRQQEDLENVEDEDISRTDSLAHCQDQQVNLVNEAEIIKPKKVTKKKFDFSKASEELLQEFPIHKQSGPKILSLTQHNLEKFLRESDSESCSSQENIHVSHNASQENSENLPVYQQYAVTLDDIRKSKASKVPPKVKGQLANLLEAIDSYCENPETYFDNHNKRSKESGKVDPLPDAQDNKYNSENISTEKRLGTHRDDLSKSNIAVTPNPQSSENIEGSLSNVSVVSDLTDLNSPSENDFDTNDKADENMVNTHGDGDHINQMGECKNNLNNKLEATNDEKCNINIINGCSETDNQTSGKNVKEMNGVTGMDKTANLEDCETFGKSDNIGQLDDIDLKTSPLSNSRQEDLEGFQKVVHKQGRKKSPGCVQKTVNGVSNDQTVWRIYGKNVIQVDGLPQKCDVSKLHDVVSGFGMVVDYQIMNQSMGTSMRFKLHTEDACEYAVQCLDETDCLFPDNRKLKCHQLQT